MCGDFNEFYKKLDICIVFAYNTTKKKLGVFMTNTEEIIERLKKHFLLGTDKALREELEGGADIARPTMDLAKKRGEFSKNFEYAVCKKYGFNHEWLKFGTGEKFVAEQSNS